MVDLIIFLELFSTVHDNLFMIAMDTLKAYQSLTAAEMPEKQAQALVAIVQELQEARLANVATKEDITAVRSEMREMESRLEARIERVKFDLLKWLIPFLLGQLALTITVLFKLIK
jgi:hypothetical protein